MKNNKMFKTQSIFVAILLMMTLLISSAMVMAKTRRVNNGDEYITSIRLNHGDGEKIVDGDTMYINEKYSLEYDWKIPDDTFKKGDTLDFTIPKEFKIVDKTSITLKAGNEEVAQANVLGDDTDGYYIHMTFTTDYVEEHSSVSGKFDFNFMLNETYIKQGSNNTIKLPDRDIIVHVPEYENPGEGGGGGVDAGDINANNKMGQEPEFENKQHPVVFKWQIDLGKNKLLGKANSFDEIAHIWVEDTPIDQKFIPFVELDDYWGDSFAFDGAFFTNADWTYGGLLNETPDLTLIHQGDYIKSFKLDILPRINHYTKAAETEDEKLTPDFKQYKIEYYTEPLRELSEDTEFFNHAKITIEYKNGETDTWELRHSVMYNVAEGSITGETGGVTFKKIDGDTKKPLAGAEFDLYKENKNSEPKKLKTGLTTDKDGNISVKDLPVGNYYFIETKAPEGYELSDKKLSFALTSDDMSAPNQEIKIKGLPDFENHQPKKTSVNVIKKWDDANNQDGLRPNSINVQLYADGKKSGKPVELNESNNWSYTWSNLAESENGTSITYTVKEVDTIPGYDVKVSNNNQGNIVITNTHKPDVTQVTGEKEWDDANNQDGKRPSSIKVNLLADGKVIDSKTVTEKENWKYEFTNLPKYKAGELIKYTVTEDAVPEYSTEHKGNTIINHYTPGKTSVTVTKNWEDKNNQDGLRPNAINVQLYADGKESGKTVELNKGNNWSYTWQELAEKKNGKTIAYTVKEVNTIPGYEVSVSDNQDGNITITNTHKPETTNVSGEKQWQDANNQDGKRPTSVKINLLANGKVVSTTNVTAENNWKYEFTNLPKYESGELINYTVAEESVPEYSTQIKDTTIINSYTPGKTSVSVVKRWEDGHNQDGLRPNTINVQLYANGKESGKPVELNEANNWSHSWQGLAEKSEGKTIVYTVKEVDSIPGYSVNISDNNEGNITITNTHTPELTQVTGEKNWDDANNQDGKRPSTIKVNLLADGEVVESKTVSEKDNWKYEFTNLPKFKNGKEIVYTVLEDSVPEYSTNINGTSITNHYTPGKTSVTVTKRWEDNNNQDGLRPNVIQVQLYANSKKSGEPVELTEANNWSHTWQDLDEKANGKQIVYTVKEVSDVPGYTSQIAEESQGNIFITNTHTPELTQVTGEKNWDDANNQDGKRPASINVNLLANGEVVDSKTVTEKDNWKYEFTNLPKFKAGKEIIYTVTEDNVPDYSTTINGTSITNHYTPGKTSVTVTKRWEDNNNQDGLRPNMIQVQLYANGKESGKPVELNEANNWSHTWQDLDEKSDGKSIVYLVKEVTKLPDYATHILDSNPGNIVITNTHTPELTQVTGEKKWDDANNQDGKRPTSIKVNLLANGKVVDTKEVTEKDNWKYEFTNLPKFEAGKEIIYTVTEDSVPEYSTSFDGTNITNHYTPGKTSVTVTKRWEDNNNQDGKRPDEIKVQLYANDKKSGKVVKLNADNNWSHTWQELDEKENGKTIVYSVKEVSDVADYTTDVSDNHEGNIVITNTHTPEVTEVAGEKKWDDANNQDGKRPTSIKVNLLADGKVVDTKEVTEKEDWKYHFTNLPKYEDGKEIIYTVTEDSVPDYSTTIDGTNITNHYTPGKTSVTVTKRWEDNNQEDKRTKDIQVQLLADGEKSGKPVKLNAKNNWTHTWENLDEKQHGKKITYTVEEITDVPDYSTTVDDSDLGNVVITNTLNDIPKQPEKDPGTGSNGNQSSSGTGSSNTGGKLPTTGEKRQSSYLLIGMMLLIAVACYFVIIKKKQSNDL